MSENTTPRLYPLATLPLDVAFNRMKKVLEQATGSPLKDTAKNTQKIGEALATFCGEASWHALNVKSKALSNSTNESDYEREMTLLRRILIPVANSFLIDNSELVKDALSAGVNLQHYLKPRTDDEFVMHVESAWEKFQEDDKAAFLANFYTSDRLMNFTPDDAKEQFDIPVPVRDDIEAAMICREMVDNLLYVLGQWVEGSADRPALMREALLDVFDNADTSLLSKLLGDRVPNAL
jgi:hypothetical protein